MRTSWLVTTLLGAGCAALQPIPVDDWAELSALEDARDTGGAKLERLALAHPDPLLRARAALALGRAQDPATAPALLRALKDPESQVRAEAAFALGLLGRSWAPLPDELRGTLGRGLLEAEASERNAAVRLELVDALGRVATEPSVAGLVRLLASANQAEAARAALALGVAARLQTTKLPTSVTPALTALLGPRQPEASRYAGAYALGQLKHEGARPGLLLAAADDAADVRALGAKGLGELPEAGDGPTLRALLDDPQPRVAVEATRALAKRAMTCPAAQPCAALEALGVLAGRAERLARGGSTAAAHPVLALAQAPLPTAGAAVLASVRAGLRAVTTPIDVRLARDLASLDCRLAAALDRLAGALGEVRACGFGLVPEGRRLAVGLRELATVPAGDPVRRAAEVVPLLSYGDPKVRLAALEVLGKTNAPAALEAVRAQLAAEDLVIAGAAAGAAAELGDRQAIPALHLLFARVGESLDVGLTVAEAFGKLGDTSAIDDLQHWLRSPHVALRQAAAQALTVLTGAPVAVPQVAAPRPDAPVPAYPLGLHGSLVVVTERGEMEIELFATDAPRTAFNLWRLARAGYFKELTFHRVVPDFVVQGGDPRGDGEGGPGYAVRCEVNHHPYVRGTVGMALSGKDTGGSQFFVALAPQPHLDGRYTTFGRVVRGLDVADALLEGDRIVDVIPRP